MQVNKERYNYSVFRHYIIYILIVRSEMGLKTVFKFLNLVGVGIPKNCKKSSTLFSN